MKLTWLSLSATERMEKLPGDSAYRENRDADDVTVCRFLSHSYLPSQHNVSAHGDGRSLDGPRGLALQQEIKIVADT